jgi:predicted SprT family Zn-dependent metalloprotease
MGMSGILAKFSCMCGSRHSVAWKRAMDGIGVAQWTCTDCRRRFVLTHQDPGLFTPIYLDAGVRPVEPRETGAANPHKKLKTPQAPPAIEFRCRCGEALTAHSWMYGATTRCTGCKASIFVALRYHLREKRFVILPEYPPSAVQA